MLDPKFQNLCLMSFFISCEQGVVVVEEYDASFSHLIFCNVIIMYIWWLNQKMNLFTK